MVTSCLEADHGIWLGNVALARRCLNSKEDVTRGNDLPSRESGPRETGTLVRERFGLSNDRIMALVHSHQALLHRVRDSSMLHTET